MLSGVKPRLIVSTVALVQLRHLVLDSVLVSNFYPLSMIATNLEHSLTAQKTAVYLQKACLQHQYIRSRDTSCIVERPERLRAVNIGLAAAVSRLEECTPVSNARSAAQQTGEPASADDLAAAIGQLNIASSSRPKDPQHPIEFVHSSAKVDLLHNAAVKFIHGDIEGDVYLENLKRWSQESHEKVSKGESEIPATLAQGDLYCMYTCYTF